MRTLPPYRTWSATNGLFLIRSLPDRYGGPYLFEDSHQQFRDVLSGRVEHSTGLVLSQLLVLGRWV